MSHNNENPTPDDVSFNAFLEAAEISEAEERSIADFLKMLEIKGGAISAELGLKDSHDMREIGLITIIEIRATILELQLKDETISLDEATYKKRQLIADFIVIEELERDDSLLGLIERLVPGDRIDLDGEEMQPHYAEAMAELARRADRRIKSTAVMDKAFLAADLDPEAIDVETSTARLTIAQMIVMSQLSNNRINALANRQELMFDIAKKHELDSQTTQKIIRYIDTEFPI